MSYDHIVTTKSEVRECLNQMLCRFIREGGEIKKIQKGESSYVPKYNRIGSCVNRKRGKK